MPTSIRELYAKYLAGTLSHKELTDFRTEVENLSDDALWQLMCEQLPTAEQAAPMPFDVKTDILERLRGAVRRQRLRLVMRYAAVALLFVVSLSGMYLHFSRRLDAPRMTAVNVGRGNKADIVLPDGTRVSMNGGTTLRYDVAAGGRREVAIDAGEAYFDVAKDARHPFRVSVGGTRIEVLGTTFNVRVDDKDIETALFTGSVRLTGDHLPQPITLAPGRKSIYDRTTHAVTITENDPRADTGWKDGYLVFNSLPLCDVLRKVQDWYGVDIRLADQRLAGDLLTGSFHNETLESVMQSLSLQYGFKYTVRKNHVVVIR